MSICLLEGSVYIKLDSVGLCCLTMNIVNEHKLVTEVFTSNGGVNVCAD